MTGQGRQSLRLPCFFMGSKIGILPAFGVFTGLHVLHPEPEDRVFLIAEKNIVEVDTF